MIPRSDLMRHVIMGWGKPLAILRKHGIKIPEQLARLLAMSIDLIAYECDRCYLLQGDEKMLARNRLWAIVWAIMVIIKAYGMTSEIARDTKTDDIYRALQQICKECLEASDDKSSKE